MALNQKLAVLFLVPYPLNRAPSQRFRFEQYFRFLGEKNIGYTVQSFLDEKSWNILYSKGNRMRKLWGVIKGFARRKWQMLQLGGYDYVFIHREAAPLGPPVFEWWITKIAGKKIIYDFDDALWLPDNSHENQLVAWFKWRKKTAYICKWAWKVSAGNSYLADYAGLYNTNVVLNPTTIDPAWHAATVKHEYNRTHDAIIGWTGSHSTMKYLEPFIPVMEELEKKYRLEFLLISNKKPAWTLKSLRCWLWSEKTEVEDLRRIDIGIMPLPDDDWAKGKCGFKVLQFMALEIPVVASPVGVNSILIHNNENGFLASSTQEWIEKLQLLIENPELRKKFGIAGRKTVEEKYSVNANKENFLQLFQI